ncbi:MAG: transcription-repair coupling factor [Fimbriimonadaceae bacterium]
MHIRQWVKRLPKDPSAHPLFEALRSGGVGGLASEARALFVAASFLSEPRTILVVTPHHDRMLQWQAKLVLAGVPESQIAVLPSGISALFEDAASEHIALSDRIGALRTLHHKAELPSIVIATPQAALERTLPSEILEDSFMDLTVGQEIAVESLIERLGTLGYEYAEPVRVPGQFSRRGGIVDLYATGRDLPIRLEFFGDTIEAVRTFDPQSQRSIGAVSGLSLGPSRETLFVPGVEQSADLILDAAEREAALLGDDAAARLMEVVRSDAEALRAHTFFDRLELYRPLIYPDAGCAIDLMPPGSTLVLDEPLEIDAVAARSEEELAEALDARADRGEILRSTANDFLAPAPVLANHASVVPLSAMHGNPEWCAPPKVPEAEIASLSPYRGQGESLLKAIESWRKHDLTIYFATDQPTRAQAVLSNAKITTTEEDGDFPYRLVHGNVGGGFVAPQLGLALVSDAELFGVARLKMPTRRYSEGAPITTLLDLKEGDYVVHINFGIGVFRGLVTRTSDGVEKEYLFIEYAAPDKLYVPAEQLDRIQKYLNPGDAQPRLNRLSGGDWQRTVSKAKEEARIFARDLVKLYAERKEAKRRPFGPDSPWQAEMEATFPWVETPSQMRAIVETKRDLQLDYPMDRLVCGDVGFGKTEVAIRAAFKVAQDGRQVAVLCPTTILSEQHYRNFAERLAAFPVRVEIINRFRSAKERRQITDGLKNGEVDIVIGTHALLGKEIAFKDLGLVIIDEEQKFGVKQKELLKQLRVSVDVLSMSATPIPRTLSMALMDIRQMSLITDPPPGRLPIRTFVRPYADEVVREAILRELARGGQIYYVFNRVEGIYHVAERLRKLAPMARIGIGHGQMTEAELEPVMIGFIKGEIDILLSTTIIENGIDIPNANTLIVENADRLGLSQLYQLRGRVGRSDRQAYAYLLYNARGGRELSLGALQRLEALQEFGALGSGYSLAFRDLQIRGAGELIGAKQHGAIANVGYELYQQLIDEAVAMLKAAADGAPVEDVRDPLAGLAPLPPIDLPTAAYLPNTWIPDQAQRLYYYQQIMTSGSLSRLIEVKEEIADRYGRFPAPVASIFRIVEARMQAREFGIDKIDGRDGRLAVTFRTTPSLRVMTYLKRHHKGAYTARDQVIWPYVGDPLVATEQFLHAFGLVMAEIEAERSAAELLQGT